MRIISGTARGRRLLGPQGSQVRPTADKVREALFDILAARYRLPEKARTLDLCCGTGALGLEALSRGAKSAVLVDSSPESCEVARQNARTLGFTQARVFCADAGAFLDKAKGSGFQLVFCDPPYNTLDLDGLLRRLLPALAAESLVVVEHSGRASAPIPPEGLVLLETRRYGAASLSFYSPARMTMERSPLSARVSVLRPSPTLAVATRAKALARQGEDVIDLSLGEPDFITPTHIREATKQALDGGFTKYTEVAGIPAVREAIAARAERELGLPFRAAEVVICAGVKHALFQLALALLEPGDEALIPAPYWVSYPDQVALAGGTPVSIDTDSAAGFLLTPEALDAAITPRTKLLYLNSPSNPTGATLNLRQLRGLAEVLRRHPRVWVISDEIYNAIYFGAGRAPSLLNAAPDLRPRVIVVDGASKSYAMTGWRLGWVLAPKEIADAVAALQSQSVSNVTSFSQLGLQAALTGDQGPQAEMVQAFLARRDLGVSLLSEIEDLPLSVPDGAFYFFPDARAYLGSPALAPFGAGSLGLANYLLERYRLAVVPGSAFGAEGFLRFSYTLPKEKLAEGLRRLKEGLTALR